MPRKVTDEESLKLYFYIFDTGHPCYGHLAALKMRLDVSADQYHNHIADSDVELIKVTWFFKLPADQVMVFHWIMGSSPFFCLELWQQFCQQNFYDQS